MEEIPPPPKPVSREELKKEVREYLLGFGSRESAAHATGLALSTVVRLARGGAKPAYWLLAAMYMQRVTLFYTPDGKALWEAEARQVLADYATTFGVMTLARRSRVSVQFIYRLLKGEEGYSARVASALGLKMKKEIIRIP